jgi:hypothetical protein
MLPSRIVVYILLLFASRRLHAYTSGFPLLFKMLIVHSGVKALEHRIPLRLRLLATGRRKLRLCRSASQLIS